MTTQKGTNKKEHKKTRNEMRSRITEQFKQQKSKNCLNFDKKWQQKSTRKKNIREQETKLIQNEKHK